MILVDVSFLTIWITSGSLQLGKGVPVSIGAKVEEAGDLMVPSPEEQLVVFLGGLSIVKGIVTYNWRRRYFWGLTISKSLVFGVHPDTLVLPKMTGHDHIRVFEHEAFPKITIGGRLSDARDPVLNLSIVELSADCLNNIEIFGSSICDGNKDAIMLRVDCRIRLIGASNT